MNILSLNALLLTTQCVVKYFFDCRILIKEMFCPRFCGSIMVLAERSREAIGSVWKCRKCKGTEVSILRGSIFYKAKTDLKVVTNIMFCWVARINPTFISRLYDGLISQNSVLDWVKKCRIIARHIVKKYPLTFVSQEVDILDENVLVSHQSAEIDEALIGKKAKGGKGTFCEKMLVFGINERKGKKCHVQKIPDAKKDTLVPIIRKHIDTSVEIFHDGHKSYAFLHDQGYVHHVVNHNKELVTKEGVHTNGVEGMWGCLKQNISHMHGLKSENRVDLVINEFVYRRNFFGKDQSKNWETFLKHLAEYEADILIEPWQKGEAG